MAPKGLVPAAQIDLDEGTLPADELKECHDGEFSVALPFEWLTKHLARGPADGTEHVAKPIAIVYVHWPPEVHIHVVVRRDRYRTRSLRVPTKVGTRRVGLL